MTAEPGSYGAQLTEIRVHGIGDHEYYTSLGLPREKSLNAWVQVAEPPPLPGHRLRILNWSRSSRRRTSFLWYLAFPFTLANVAGRMEPGAALADPGSQRLLAGVVAVVGLLLTLSQLAWIVVLGETVLRSLPVPDFWVSALPLTAVGLMLAWLIFRYRTVIRNQSGRRGQLGATLVHGIVLFVAGVLVTLFPPAQLPHAGWPSTDVPADGARLDAMALWIAVSTGGAFLAALLLSVRSAAASGQVGSARAPLAAAAALLAVAVPLMHAVTALLRLVIDNAVTYVAGLFALVPTPRNGTGILLAYDNPADPGDSRLDLFPFLVLIAVVAAIVAIAVVFVFAPGPGLPPLRGGKAARGRWWHSVAGSAPSLLPGIVPLAVVLALTATTTAAALGEGRLGGPWLALAILVLQIAGAFVVLVILLGQFRPLREVLGKVADVAGFWPVRDHPLAGSSYRDAAVAGIVQLVSRHSDGEVVLVAHSQGSALCAWMVAHRHGRTGSARLPHLVTAGAPLYSIYAQYFPAYFSPEVLDTVAGCTRSWTNFWRETDPVGSPVPGAENRLLPDRRSDGVVRGHSDYWTEPAIIEHVAGLAGKQA
ncbi:hypothetical protein GC088_07225 [Arthrobacter sp. JZ12]|uniref:hypothetical protein n=1 Tax=Arthrobacter sp. JZ12 TaxID=2654190 RepID=UPI002B45AC2C|nr:hypothetical protein [Arthrobacter sp. JZ12]WRH24883.1 hypothetical protein GC088_07225 [Arthrobacter sp. JZ12]